MLGDMFQHCTTSNGAEVCGGRPRKPLDDKSESTLPFPFKLHQLLEEAEECGADHIISWLPSGEAFKIHDHDAFLGSVMTKYFKMTKIKSFTRQLYIYGFTKISKGPNMGGFFHPEFRRDDQKACMTLSRRDGKEDRRVKANKPKLLDDMQRNRARARSTSCVASNISNIEQTTMSLTSVKDSRIPSSLLDFPTLPFGQPAANAQSESSNRPKRAFSLFDQTFGDDFNMDDLFACPTLGPISAIETKALPAPPSSLRIDFSKQPLPRPSIQQFPDSTKSMDNLFWKAPQQVLSNSSNDVFQVEPRSIEEMLHTFHDERVNPFPVSSLFTSDNFAENSLQVMET